MLTSLGLRSRLVLLVLLAVLPVFGLFAYSAAQNRQTVLTQAQANLQSQAQQAALHQQRLVERVTQLLDDMASGPSIRDPTNRLCVQYLKNLQSQDGDYLNLGVAALDGTVSCHAVDSGARIEVSDRHFFTQVIAGEKLVMGGYGVGRGSGRPGITFSKPVQGGDGGMNGVAFAAVDIAAVSRALEEGPMLPGAQLRVLDQHGVVLAVRPAGQTPPGSLEQDGVVLAAARAGQAGVRQAIDPGGEARVYAYAPVGGVKSGEYFVAMSVPRELITAGPDALLRTDLFALLLLTALGVAAVWWMGERLLVSRARAILRQAGEVTRGNLAARVGSGLLGQDEIGQISQAFNRMAESLQARQAERDAALRRAEEERILLHLVLNSMSEGVIAIDVHERFLMVNASARKLYAADPEPGSPVHEWLGSHQMLALDGASRCKPADRPLMQALRGASLDNWVRLLRRPGHEDRIVRVSSRPLRDAGGQLYGAVAVMSDITEIKAAEVFSASQHQVLALIAAGVPLQQSLAAIVDLVEKNAPDSLCSILLVRNRQLRHGAAPSLAEDFVRAIDGLAVAEGVGACGSAAFRKTPVMIGDVTRDPLMREYRGLLQAHGLLACWSTPVVSADGEVLATFAIYRRSPGLPQVRDEELMATATGLARIALERARAESALVGSEARFRELAENIDDVFYNVDARTSEILYVSPAYEKIWGLSCQSLYAERDSHARALVAEDRPAFALSHKRTRAGERSDVEYRILTPDGRTRWIRDHSYPVFSAGGELERIVGTAVDISASKLADLALGRTNRALQMFSRSSIALNRIDDEAGLLAEVCRVAVEVGGYRMAWVGYARDDEDESIQVMAQAGDDSAYLAAIALSWRSNSATGQGPAGSAIRNGRVEQRSDIGAAGDFFWRDAALQRGYRSCIALPLSSGQRSFGVLCLYGAEAGEFSPDEVGLLQELADSLAFGIGSLRARLERDRSQEIARLAALKVKEQASLMDQAQDAIMVRNLDGCLRFWNQGAERLFGWSADEVLGQSMYAQMYREPEAALRVREQILASKGLWTGELEKLARDGSVVEVEARWSVVHDELGRVNGTLSINTDIRERKRAHREILLLNAGLEERVTQRTAQLALANQQLEAFSYSVSHDLRSPLSAIAGFSALLDKTLARSTADPQTERGRHYLSRIRSGVAQMGELIDAMLLLAQVSRTSLRWEDVDLSVLAFELLAGYQEREPERAVRLRVEPGLQVQGDPRLLRQLLDNLLGNAWKFTQGKALAEIAVGRQNGSAGEAVYFVRDNGAGFDMAYAEKLFGAFERLHAASEYTGHGVGLATVRRIVERHGGKVWGEAAQEAGASFYFTLGKAMS